ncbi:MAG: hypothetical protein DWQ02_06425 [Bacteroidetes bacterium]|nr:MAG: hypothetical protein DWQ02_06425 [Bacteroidota bacterium]
MKNNKEFDQFVREKMQGLEPSITPDSWDFLEQRMNAQEALETDAVPENDVIDQVSREKLHNYHQPYNKTHWELMAGKLEREFYFIQELFRVKTMEVSLMLLLLLILGRLIPGDIHKMPAINVDNRMIVQSELEISDQQNVVADNAVLTDNTDLPVVSSISNNNPAAQKTTDKIVSQPRNEAVFINSLPLTAIAMQTDRVTEFPSAIITPVSSAVDILDDGALALLETREPEMGLNFIPYQQRDISVRVGMYGGPNLDHIVNEPTIIGGEEIPSLNRYALGYSGGISLGVGLDRLEVETGLVYTSKRYQPIEVQFVAGNVEKGFRNEAFKFFEFNSLTVPVNIRFNVIDRAKWRVYAFAGGAAHFNAHAYYHVGPPELSDENRDQSNTFGGRNSVIEQLERGLVDGIFQEGEFRENAYLSVNGGLGLERSIGDRWSFFTQSNYQHTLLYEDGGLGPFKDIIHSISISTGLKVRVNGK